MRIRDILIPHQPRLCLHLNSEAYSEHSKTSKMESFPEIVHGSQPQTIFTENAISDIY